MIDSVRRAAVVVAHCDDETLWAGGLLARYGERITVIACSIPRADPVRAYKFFDACAVFGAAARLLPFTETALDEPLAHLGVLDLSGFDMVVTHNRAGEYGHFHHKALHRFIMERWADRTACFGWQTDGRGEVVLHLTAEERVKKLAALKCYDHTSSMDAKPKWQALIDRYSIDFRVETYHAPRRA